MTIERTNESVTNATTPLNEEQLKDLQPIEKAEGQVRGGLGYGDIKGDVTQAGSEKWINVNS